MIITQLDFTSFRNIRHATLSPHPALNLITGNNGSGKSSILEAVQCLATGHSFRTRKPRELINHSDQSYQLTCTFVDKMTDAEHRAGLMRSRDGAVNLRLDFEDVKTQSTITRLLPVKAMTPDSLGLVLDGPDSRRQFLDWGLFHVEHDFLGHWRTFRRSLSQRNQVIRDMGSDKEIDTWNTSLLPAAQAIDAARKSYLVKLETAMQLRLQKMSIEFHVELAYRRGWSESHSLEELLSKNLQHHRKMKTTTEGPHRADLLVYTNDILAKQVLSRGQLKVLTYVMHLAQLDVLLDERTQTAIVLCDDVNSELDEFHTNALLSQLSELESQVFVTGISLEQLFHFPHQRFHMKHGTLENRL